MAPVAAVLLMHMTAEVSIPFTSILIKFMSTYTFCCFHRKRKISDKDPAFRGPWVRIFKSKFEGVLQSRYTKKNCTVLFYG